jgi:hypothetical protein
MEGGMKVEARNLAIGVVAVAVVDKSVKCIRDAIDWDCWSREIVIRETQRGKAEFFGKIGSFLSGPQ